MNAAALARLGEACGAAWARAWMVHLLAQAATQELPLIHTIYSNFKCQVSSIIFLFFFLLFSLAPGELSARVRKIVGFPE